MKKLALIGLTLMGIHSTVAQEVMTPELLWKLGRVTALGISKDGKNVVYKVATPVMEDNKSTSKYYQIPIAGGTATEVKEIKDIVKDKNISPDGLYLLSSKEVKVNNVLAKDLYRNSKKPMLKYMTGWIIVTGTLGGMEPTTTFSLEAYPRLMCV